MPVINTNVLNSSGDERDRQARNAAQMNQAFQGLTNTFMDVAKFGEAKRQYNVTNRLKTLYDINKAQGGNWKQLAQSQPGLVKASLQGLVPDNQLDDFVLGMQDMPETSQQMLERSLQGVLSGNIDESMMQQQGTGGGTQGIGGTVNQEQVSAQGPATEQQVTPGIGMTIGDMNQPVGTQNTGVAGPQNSERRSGGETRGFEEHRNTVVDRAMMHLPENEQQPESQFDVEFVKKAETQAPKTDTITQRDVFEKSFLAVDQRARKVLEANPDASPQEVVNQAFDFGAIKAAPPTQGILQKRKKGETYAETYIRLNSAEEWERVNQYAKELGLKDGESLYWARQQLYANVDPGQGGPEGKGVQEPGYINWEADYGISDVFAEKEKAALNPDMSIESRKEAWKAYAGVTGASAIAKTIAGEDLTPKEDKLMDRWESSADVPKEKAERLMYTAVKKEYEPYANALNVLSKRGYDPIGLLTGMAQAQADLDYKLQQTKESESNVDFNERKLDLMRDELNAKINSAEAQEQLMGAILQQEMFTQWLKEAGPNIRESIKSFAPIVQAQHEYALKMSEGDPDKANEYLIELTKSGTKAGNAVQSFYNAVADATGMSFEETVASWNRQWNFGPFTFGPTGEGNVPGPISGMGTSGFIGAMSQGILGGGGPAYVPEGNQGQQQTDESTENKVLGVDVSKLGNVLEDLKSLFQ